nr:UDP-2,3-diacylglucosamine diphosphatase [Kordiimonas sp. SCSIO 12603]
MKKDLSNLMHTAFKNAPMAFAAVASEMNSAPAASLETSPVITRDLHTGPDHGGSEGNSSPHSADTSSYQQDKKKDRHYRAVFISDTHLGTRAARVDLLLDFLKNITCDQLYLVGDIVDGWQIKRSWFWDTTHNDVIRRVLKMAKHGTKVVYIPGNHDEGLRGFEGHDLAGVSLEPEIIFEGANGKRYWVLHGDQFDGVMKYAKWLAHLGDHAYVLLLKLNTTVNWIRKKLGYDYWSLSAYLKHKVKNAVEYIGQYEEAVAAETRRRGLDGVICGHIHHAEIQNFDGIEYMNDGDWVESCTALVEHENGKFEILYWADIVAARDENKPKRKRRDKNKDKDPSPAPVPAE